MTLIINRIREMFWLFGMVLPIDGVHNKEAIKAALGHGMEEIIPDLMILVSQFAEKNPEDFEMYCEFIVEALDYMKGKRNSHPDTSLDYDEYQKLMLIQLGRYKNQKELKKIETSETFNPPKENENSKSD